MEVTVFSIKRFYVYVGTVSVCIFVSFKEKVGIKLKVKTIIPSMEPKYYTFYPYKTHR